MDSMDLHWRERDAFLVCLLQGTHQYHLLLVENKKPGTERKLESRNGVLLMEITVGDKGRVTERASPHHEFTISSLLRTPLKLWLRKLLPLLLNRRTVHVLSSLIA